MKADNVIRPVGPQTVNLRAIRSTCIQSASAFCASRPELKSVDLFQLAERMEAWVLR